MQVIYLSDYIKKDELSPSHLSIVIIYLAPDESHWNAR